MYTCSLAWFLKSENILTEMLSEDSEMYKKEGTFFCLLPFTMLLSHEILCELVLSGAMPRLVSSQTAGGFWETAERAADTQRSRSETLM